MKNKFLLPIFILLCCNTVYGQDTLNEKILEIATSSDTIPDKQGKAHEIINKMRQSLVEPEKVGTLYLYNITASVYSPFPKDENRTVVETITITQVLITVFNGTFVDIVVYAKNGDRYVNKNAISIRQFHKLKNINYLHLESPVNGKQQYICIGEIFNYDNGVNYYIPNDTSIALPAKDSAIYVNLMARRDLNSLVDIKLFTDGLALFDQQSNGLVQTEITSKIILNTWGGKGFTAFNYIKPFATIAKFDSKYASLSRDTLDSLNVPRMKLYQQSYLQAGFALNLFRLSRKEIVNFHIDGGGFIAFSNVNNTKDSGKESVLMNTIFADIGLNIRRISPLTFDIGITPMYQNISPTSGLSNDGYIFILRSYLMLSYSSNEFSRNKIFLRYSGFTYFQEKSTSFNQLQIGYSINLNDALAKSK